MTPNGPPTTAVRENERLRADPRLPPYLIAGFGALVVAITTGHGELAALGAPFLALAAIGLLAAEPPRVDAGVTLHSTRVIEGERVDGVVHLDWAGQAEVDVLLAGCRGVLPLDPAPVVGWSLPMRRGPVTLPFQLRALAWGAHEVGTLWVRVRRPGGLLVLEQKLASPPTLQVLPRPLRLAHLLNPAEPRAVAGVHTSRIRGHGTDFAELRPCQPGDRVRDLSWSTTARLGEPWVAVHRSERTGTVLLLLDTVFSNEPRSIEALARAARAAWAVAQLHLRAQDRVGLLARGRTIAWLTPRSGRRARWLLLEGLLAIGGAAEDPWPRRRWGSRIVVPRDALIIGVTGLESAEFISAVLPYRRRGHRAVALVIDSRDLLPAPESEVDAAARRIWIAQREARRYALEGGGVPTAVITAAEGVGPAISALRRRMGLHPATRARARVR
jgi:uncharacterized protein (DUF58 family)